MRLQRALLALALAAICACDASRDRASDAPAPSAGNAAPAEGAPDRSATDAAGAGAAGGAATPGDAAGPGTDQASFEGIGAARLGDSADAVRQALGGDLGDEQAAEPGGCHYLIPQPLGAEGYRTAFMIEGDRLVRIDVRDAAVAAPGGARLGTAGDAVRALYQGRVEEQPHKYDPQGRVLRVTAPDGGPGVLVFELDADGRVDEWRLGLPPQVDYVEGCS